MTVPSQLLFDIIRKAPESSKIEVKNQEELGQVFIFFGESKFSLPYLSTQDFPEMENEILDNSVSIGSDKLSYLIDDCKFSMGIDESRQFLNGIYFNNEKVHVLYNGVNRHIKKFPEKKKEILFVGRLVVEKGAHLYGFHVILKQ